MNWFIWRQHRKQLLILGLILLAYGAVVVPTGVHFWHVYQQAVANCAKNPATPICSDLPNNLFQSTIDHLLFRLVPLAILVLPLLLSVFMGAPLIAREYAEGTNSLVWTQSASRRKWLTVKLLWVLGATAVFAAGLVALNTWWSNTSNSLFMDRFSGGFSTQDIVPVAYIVFAVALGIMLGAWFKKTMVAAGVGLGLLIAIVVIAVPNLVRPHYMSPIKVTATMGPVTSSTVPDTAWITNNYIVDKNGETFSRLDFTNMPAQCQQIIQQDQVSTEGHGVRIKAMPGDPIDTCIDAAGYRQVTDYQPASRYWDFQYIEAGIYLALAALSVGATYWFVIKHDA